MNKAFHCSRMLLCLFGICFAPSALIGQAPTYSWAKGIGGTGADLGVRMVTDAAGNSYTTGSFTGTVDFDPHAVNSFNLTSAGGIDIFVCKLDAAGDFVWAVNMGGSGDDEGKGLALDGSDNVYLTGLFRNTADFNLASPGINTLTAVGGADVFVCKLNSSGAYIWAAGAGSTSDDQGNAIALDASDNVISVGNLGATGAADFDPGMGTTTITSFGGTDDFVWKLDNNGNFIYVKQMGCTTSDLCNGIALDGSDNMYITGSFNATADFDPHPVNTYNLTSAGSNDIFLCKLDAAGDFVWAVKMGSTSTDIGNAVLVDNTGAVLFTGSFGGTVNFDPLGSPPGSVVASGTSDPFVCKFDASGNFTWVKTFSGSGFDRGHSLAVDGSNNVYNSGAFQNTMDFDPGVSTFSLTSAGGTDAYITCLTSAGNFVWSLNVGGTLDESGQSVKLAGGNVYLAGRFNVTADFDPDGTGVANLSSAGSTDIFVAKYQTPGCAPTSSMITTTSCDNYTLNSTTYTTSGTYMQTLTNVAGCDSTITLNLTINLSSNSSITAAACDDYTLNSMTYTSSGTYMQTLTNVAGCDSTITLNLTINESTDSAITVTACDSYTLNSTTYTSSNVYMQMLTNSAGCDSVITLNLTIDPLVDTGVTAAGTTITADATGATYQWIDCGTLAPIAGETGQSYTATGNGSYAVIVTDGTCSDTSTCTTINDIGMDETSHYQLQLSPNPAGEMVMLTGAQAANCTFVDMTGRTVLEFSVQSGKSYIEIQDLTPGVYVLHIEGKTTGIRLVKL